MLKAVCTPVPIRRIRFGPLARVTANPTWCCTQWVKPNLVLYTGSKTQPSVVHREQNPTWCWTQALPKPAVSWPTKTEWAGWEWKPSPSQALGPWAAGWGSAQTWPSLALALCVPGTPPGPPVCHSASQGLAFPQWDTHQLWATALQEGTQNHSWYKNFLYTSVQTPREGLLGLRSDKSWTQPKSCDQNWTKEQVSGCSKVITCTEPPAKIISVTKP